jgi:hypothetical protein
MDRFIWPIWISNALLQWGLLFLLLRKNSWRRHQAFAAFIAFCCCKTSFLMWVRLFERPMYLSVHWGTQPIVFCLMIAVLVEVFAAVFQPYYTLPKGTLRWFKIAFVSVILLTVATALCFPGSAPGNLMNTVLVLNRSSSVVFCGAYGFIAIFSTYFGIPWQHRTYGIGVGFLFLESVDIFAYTMIATYGYGIAAGISVVSMLAFTLTLITWMIYFARPEVPSRAPSLEQLKRLQKALDYTSAKAESYEEQL